jgi:hypothetical protein
MPSRRRSQCSQGDKRDQREHDNVRPRKQGKGDDSGTQDAKIRVNITGGNRNNLQLGRLLQPLAATAQRGRQSRQWELNSALAHTAYGQRRPSWAAPGVKRPEIGPPLAGGHPTSSFQEEGSPTCATHRKRDHEGDRGTTESRSRTFFLTARGRSSNSSSGVAFMAIEQRSRSPQLDSRKLSQSQLAAGGRSRGDSGGANATRRNSDGE